MKGVVFMRTVIAIGWVNSWAGIALSLKVGYGPKRKMLLIPCFKADLVTFVPSNMTTISSDIQDQKDLIKRVRNITVYM